MKKTLLITIFLLGSSIIGMESYIPADKLQSAFFYACDYGYLDSVRNTLEKGADPHKSNEEDLTGLHLAAQQGHIEIVKLLLESGARPKAQNPGPYYYTPLHVAAQFGYPEICALLISKGANVDEKTNAGFTPLHYAACGALSEVCALLINKGANLDEKTKEGYTALHLATGMGYPEICALLLDRNTNPTRKNIPGKSTLYNLVQSGLRKVSSFFDKKTSIETKTSQICTSLYIAAEKGRWEICSLLLELFALEILSKESPSTKWRITIVSTLKRNGLGERGISLPKDIICMIISIDADLAWDFLRSYFNGCTTFEEHKRRLVKVLKYSQFLSERTVAKLLTLKLFRHLHELLQKQLHHYGNPMTAHELAQRKNHNELAKFLDPTTLENRLESIIISWIEKWKREFNV